MIQIWEPIFQILELLLANVQQFFDVQTRLHFRIVFRMMRKIHLTALSPPKFPIQLIGIAFEIAATVLRFELIDEYPNLV